MTVALEVDSGPLACAIRILRKRSHSEISVENLASSSSSSHTQASATEIIKKTPASSSCSVKSVTNATPDITFSSCASVVASDRIPALVPTNDAAFAKVVGAVARVFSEPSDLSFMCTTSLVDSEFMPCAMIKYDECRSAFHKAWSAGKKINTLAQLERACHASLSTFVSLPKERRSELHHNFYVLGGQTPGPFANKLEIHNTSAAAKTRRALWVADILVTAVHRLRSCSEDDAPDAAANLLKSLLKVKPAGVSASGSKYNAHWLVRTVEYTRPTAPVDDLVSLQWSDIIGPVPNDFALQYSPGVLVAIATRTGASLEPFRLKPSLLKVLACFIKCTLGRIEDEKHCVSTVVQKSATPPDHYIKPDVDSFINCLIHVSHFSQTIFCRVFVFRPLSKNVQHV